MVKYDPSKEIFLALPLIHNTTFNVNHNIIFYIINSENFQLRKKTQ